MKDQMVNLENMFLIEINKISNKLITEAITHTDGDIEDAIDLIRDATLINELESHPWLKSTKMSLFIILNTHEEYEESNCDASELSDLIDVDGVEALYKNVAFNQFENAIFNRVIEIKKHLTS